MSLIDTVIRPDVLAMSVYQVPDATGFLKLDAMENPYRLPDTLRHELGQCLADVALNRYPVPSYTALKQTISRQFGVPMGFDVVLGNGSDELIAIVSIACAKPGACVLAPVPGFVMYAVSAQLAGLDFVGVPLQPDFSLDLPAMLDAITRHRPVITYLAYPNNPTGALFDVQAMQTIIEHVGDSGVVIVDEAYQPFAQASFMPRLPEFGNVIVMRTLSKLGLAGARLAYMSGADGLLTEFDKVRPPYNINVLTQCAGLVVLEHTDVLNAQAAMICQERSRVAAALSALPGVTVFPSDANFLLIRVDLPDFGGNALHASLLAHKILIKNVGKMHSLLQDCLRITVSTPAENTLLLQAVTEILSKH
jgi:histidinol-phosphate aminotransferase